MDMATDMGMDTVLTPQASTTTANRKFVNCIQATLLNQ